MNLYKRTDFTPPLRLAIHVVQYSDGTGGISQNNLDQKIIDLRYFFEQALFEFYIFKVDSIDNDQYASIDNFDEADELRTINEVASCINVYFVPLFPGYNGLSSFSPRIQDPVLQSEQGIIIRNEAPGTTLPHEMGHYFDLFHTFETYFGIENIPRTGGCANWSTDGDMLRYTKANPSDIVTFSTINSNCEWDPKKALPPDECGYSNYNPQANNMMITEVKYCRTTFTEDQKDRMNRTLEVFRPELLWNAVYLENSANNSNAGGTLQVDNEPLYNSGEYAMLEDGNYDIGTNDERFSNYQSSGITYKHNNWNETATDYFLFRNIPVLNDDNQIANFKDIRYSKIEARLEGQLIQNKGEFEFQDPWFVKSDGTQPGNYWRPCVSYYEPTGKEGAQEKGVFLNQEIAANKPYYSVGTLDEQPINPGGGIGTRDFYFYNWSGTGVSFQDANANQTGVVFTSSNAVLTANLKGNLLSNSPGGFSTNSQRKIVRTDNGYYHLVYESLGNVYYTHSLTTDFYGDWTREELLMTKATNPSLDYVGNDVYIVYEIYDTDYSNQPVVHLLKLLYDNSTWFLDWYTDVAYNEVSNLGYAKPVVYARSDEVFVIAKLSANERLKYTYIIDPENPSSQWSTPADLPGPYQYSVDPTLAGGKLNNDDYLHISYEGKNRIYYLFSYRAGSERRFNTPVDISSGSSYSINKYPSISLVSNQFYPIVTWRGAF
ncbi:MAG: hypothetical protein IIA49_16180, partial [Bacteroidetes bacterium]|nr:hypothetical protein [Bacteroidota bacterium]